MYSLVGRARPAPRVICLLPRSLRDLLSAFLPRDWRPYFAMLPQTVAAVSRAIVVALRRGDIRGRRQAAASASGRRGTLHIVATPIGNAHDLSKRAADVLTRVPIIAAESVHTAEALLSRLRGLRSDGDATGTAAACASQQQLQASATSSSRFVPPKCEAQAARVAEFAVANALDQRAARELQGEPAHIQDAVIMRGSLVGLQNPSAALLGRIQVARRSEVAAASCRVVSYHSHNEVERIPELLAALENGDDVALVSRAGTPGWRDPGPVLVAAAHRRGLKVRVLPGPSCVAAALSVSGLSGDRVLFEGYLPAMSHLRLQRLRRLRDLGRACAAEGGGGLTVALFGDGATLDGVLADAATVLGREAAACICGDLTTPHERVMAAPLGELQAAWAGVDPEARRGALVFLVELGNKTDAGDEVDAVPRSPFRGAAQGKACASKELERVTEVLVRSGLPQQKVALVAMQLTGASISEAQQAAHRVVLGVSNHNSGAVGSASAREVPSDGEGDKGASRRTLHLTGLGPYATDEEVGAALARACVAGAYVSVTENHVGEKIAFARFASAERAATARVAINLAALELGAGRPLRAGWSHRERWIT